MAGENTEDIDNPENEAETPEFDFNEWATEIGLNRKTTAKLKQEDLCTERTLALLVSTDIRELGLAIGQRKLLETAIQQFTAQRGPQTIQPLGASASATVSGTTSQLNADPTSNTAHSATAAPSVSHTDARMTIGDVRRQVHNGQQLMGAGKTLDMMLGSAPIEQNKDHKQSTTNYAFDPRTLLTIKSSSKKAVHITQFLSEATKKRRQARKRKFVLGEKQGDSHLVITTDDEHPYSGLSIEEWSAANCRVMAHLLQMGDLAISDIDYYLAYSVQVYDFAQKYEWEGLLDFDYQYREREAEHSFPWGSNTGNMELSLLQAKSGDFPSHRPHHQDRGYYGGQRNSPHNQQGRSYDGGREETGKHRPQQTQDCRLFLSRDGYCPFGDKCIYNHPVNAPKAGGDRHSKN